MRAAADMSPTPATTRSSVLASPGPLLHRLLARLVAADARYREARRLEDLPDERLRDIGLTRVELATRAELVQT